MDQEKHRIANQLLAATMSVSDACFNMVKHKKKREFIGTEC